MSLDNCEVIEKLERAVADIEFNPDFFEPAVELIKEAIEMLKNDGVSNE